MFTLRKRAEAELPKPVPSSSASEARSRSNKKGSSFFLYAVGALAIMICFETYWTMNAMGIPLIELGNSTSGEETINIDVSETALISEGKPATSDVNGNLGKAQVVTSESVSDWLKDRWQAAKDMSGNPIEGEHWIEVDLQSPAIVTSVLIDWEAAFSDDYSLSGRMLSNEEWKVLFDSKSSHFNSSTPAPKHVHHTFEIPQLEGEGAATHLTSYGADCYAPTRAVRYVRLLIRKPSTSWGVSIWRLQIYGKQLAKCKSNTTAF
uniref:F5/8 type C domain-containing protein n=1 Tax=Hanusia phi TaxID=3032 RepID=A0A7S0DU09_9CRYP|mmetsp:Transcript_10075/g.22982  ORF Transcript_10075/g.22982 Transcript_10075/m.22982 type:complete len:264 (+) Transcript_10075:34-825(+)